LTFLEPRNKTEMLTQLAEVPREKRKAVVLVGKHPGEGSARIARKLHAEWESLGAAVVRIPESMTPHAFWTRVVNARKKSAHLSDRMLLRLPPSDREVIEAINRRFGVPVVNFHGTAHMKRTEPKQILRFLVSPFGSVKKSHLKELAGRLHARKLTREHVRIMIPREFPRIPHPNSVLVEHFFRTTRHAPSTEEEGRLTAQSILLLFNLDRRMENNPEAKERFQQLVPYYFMRKPKKVPELSKQHETALNELITLLAELQSKGVFARERK